MFAWDDIAVFLALYRERTTGRAADSLGCSQPTVTRRLAALEQGLGLSLFDRSPAGLQPTDAANRLFESAQAVERAVCAFSSDVDLITGSRQNEIRLTLLDHFERLLVPLLREFHERWPAVHTQLLPSDRIYDLSRGEADVAIRGRARPSGDEIVVRELPPTGWTVFASRHSCASEIPRSPAEVVGHPIAMLDSAAGRLPVYEWLYAQAADAAKPIRCSNYSALRSVIASGAALSVLPWTVGSNDPDLVACFPPMEEYDVEIFLVARRAALRLPPARDLFDSIGKFFAANPTLLTGRTT